MKPLLASVAIGTGTAAIQDIRRFRTRKDKSEKFDWQFFGLTMLEGAIAGMLIGLGADQVIA